MNQQIPGLDPHLVYFLPFFAIFGFVMSILLLIPYWMIFKKAGFTPWLSLLILVPLVNVIVLYVIAFARWNVVPAPGMLSPYGRPYAGPPAPVPPGPPAYRG